MFSIRRLLLLVQLALAGGTARQARLVSLSSGGAALSDCPEEPVGARLSLTLPDGGAPVAMTVLGAEAGVVRLAFTPPLAEARVARGKAQRPAA